MESASSIEQPLWRPPPEQISQSNLARFCEWLREKRSLNLQDHRSLYDWSVRDLEGFWSAIAEFFAVRFHTPAERVLQRAEDPIQTKWFPGATLNYTEHLLRFGSTEIGQFDHRPAVIFCTEPGKLVLTAPMPCMPVAFWNDPDGSRLRQAYFQHFPGIWRHGDGIEIDPETGQCLIYGRSDSTLNRGGVRMGTSEFYRVVESLPEILGSMVIDTTGLGSAGEETPGKLVLFIVLREAVGFDDFLANRIRERIRIELSPRYVPEGIFQVPEIPQTLNGKKLEVPVKRIFLGIELSKSVSREAMSNPDSLKPFLELAEKYST